MGQFADTLCHRKGHYNRALEEAIHTFARQWPRAWQAKSPLAGGVTFKTMSTEQRVSIQRGFRFTHLYVTDIASTCACSLVNQQL